MNQEEANQKILEIMNNRNLLSQEEIQLFKKLMFECDLKIQDKNGYTPLMYVFMYNKEKNLNLNQEQLDYLIKNSDLKIQDQYGYSPLMYALFYNKNQNLNINKEQWDYLIKNSDLTQKDKYGWTSLFHALNHNKTKNLKLTIKQFQIMYESLNTKQQQNTFQKFIHANYNNNHQYIEEINMLLYDCKFKPDEETINSLKENKHQNILEMIEKRDVFFQLNQDFKEIDNRQKIATIKL